MRTFPDFLQPSFSGHESFPLRYLWLKKGYDLLQRFGSDFFARDDAMVVLGVGKNMVRAIRHWGLACETWAEVPETRGRCIEPTPFGHLLLGETAWDAFLEDDATLWWLHWRLVQNPGRATAWSWLFGRPKRNRFGKDELVAELEDLAERVGGTRLSRASLRRDVDVLVRTYTRARWTRARSVEDVLDAPLMRLRLIRPAVEQGTFEIVQGKHPSLPSRIFAAAVLEFAGAGEPDVEPRRTISFDDLAYAPLSPGRTFRLSEDAVVERLSRLGREYPDTYQFDETAGLRQLLLVGDLPAPTAVLADYYQRRLGAHA